MYSARWGLEIGEKFTRSPMPWKKTSMNLESTKPGLRSLTADHLSPAKVVVGRSCNNLPALELCYSMSQKFLDDKHKSPESSLVEDSPSPPPVTTTPIANWKISSPGDNPDDVKASFP
ncbi:unnamed protein product [Arabidopsis halleri]